MRCGSGRIPTSSCCITTSRPLREHKVAPPSRRLSGGHLAHRSGRQDAGATNSQAYFAGLSSEIVSKYFGTITFVLGEEAASS